MTVMPVVSRVGSWAFGVDTSVPSPTIAPGPTTTSLSRIERSTTALVRITESNMTIESRTTAPDVDAHARREDRVHDGPVHDAAVADQAAMDLRRRADVGRWPLLRPGVDRPGAVVEVEVGHVFQERHVRFPVALDRADVLPVAVEAVAEDARPTVDHRGDHVGAEVGPRLVEPALERPLREHVHAHAGEVALGLLGLLLPLDDAPGLVLGEDPHARASLSGTRRTAIVTSARWRRWSVASDPVLGIRRVGRARERQHRHTRAAAGRRRGPLPVSRCRPATARPVRDPEPA